MALQHVHAQRGVALGAVVRRNAGNHPGNARHQGRPVQRLRVERRGWRLHAKLRGRAHLVRHFGALDQRLAGHAAVMQAVAAQAISLHQRHFGLRRCRNIGRHQATGACANHDQIGVKLPGPLAAPGREKLAQALAV